MTTLAARIAGPLVTAAAWFGRFSDALAGNAPRAKALGDSLESLDIPECYTGCEGLCNLPVNTAPVGSLDTKVGRRPHLRLFSPDLQDELAELTEAAQTKALTDLPPQG